MPALPETARIETPAIHGNAGQARPPAALPLADGKASAAPSLAEQADAFYAQGKYGEAAQLYRQLAEQGDAKSQTRLGTMTLQGQGMDKNLDQGVAWYAKAASQGDAEAQNTLGQLFVLTKDYRQALLWYRKAAAQGFADAQYHLGVMCEKGQGLAADRAQAVSWYRKAAATGHERAKKHLIRLGISRNEPPRE